MTCLTLLSTLNLRHLSSLTSLHSTLNGRPADFTKLSTMHRRTAAPTSAKVAASRERRAARLRNGGAGSIAVPYNSHAKHADGGGAFRKKLIVAAGTLTVGILSGLWIAALYHVTSNTDAGGDVGGGSKYSFPKSMNTLRQMRHKNTEKKTSALSLADEVDYSNIYTEEALQKNPYLGWQPQFSPPDNNFSWRSCFKAKPTADASDQPIGCRENPTTFGSAPAAPPNWIPDVAMIRTMLMHGKDRQGNPFPPPLDEELCEDIAVQGGKSGDSNKECLRQSSIMPTGPLNSTTVTIQPGNHYGSTGGSKITIPAPKLMCLVYTMADAHSNRIQGMRETWAGGCDGFLAFSTESDPRLPAISLPHDGPEECELLCGTSFSPIVSCAFTFLLSLFLISNVFHTMPNFSRYEHVAKSTKYMEIRRGKLFRPTRLVLHRRRRFVRHASQSENVFGIVGLQRWSGSQE